MKARILILAILLSSAVVSCFAADTVWHARRVAFAEAAIIGGTAVPPGEYKVEHLMRGDEHIMVFTSVNDKKLRAESKCHMLKNPQKETRSVQAYELVNGKNTLKTLIFKGDRFVHELY